MQGRNQALHFGRGGVFMNDVMVPVQPCYNFFSNGHRQSSLRNISENENFSVLIKMQTEWLGQTYHQMCVVPATFARTN